MLLMFAFTCCCFQVPIFDLLKKFDGQHTSDDIKAGRRRFRLTKLPSYLVLHIKRFTKNNFFIEKNPTIVNFPVKNLELRDVVPVPIGKPALPQGCYFMSVIQNGLMNMFLVVIYYLWARRAPLPFTHPGKVLPRAVAMVTLCVEHTSTRLRSVTLVVLLFSVACTSHLAGEVWVIVCEFWFRWSPLGARPKLCFSLPHRRQDLAVCCRERR